MIFFCSIGLLKMVDRFYISLFKNGFFVLLHIYKDFFLIKFRIIKMDRRNQVERKKQIQSKIRYIEGLKKNGRRTAELKELKKELSEINFIVDYSSSSNSRIGSVANPRGSSSSRSSSSGSNSSGSSSSINSSSSSSSSSSSINCYINTANDDDDDFQDFFNNMEDPEVANLNKIQMLKDFYLFVIAKSKFLLFEIINNLY